MKFRGISSSTRTCIPKSLSTPFPLSSYSSHQDNPFSILNSFTINTPNNTTTTGDAIHDDDDDAAPFIGPPPSQTEVHDALSSLQR